MALTTESFTSVHATWVSGVQSGSLTSPSSRLLSSRCVLSVDSSITLPLRKCTFIVLHFLYSCIIGDSNLKLHVQKYPHTSMHQWFQWYALPGPQLTLSLKGKISCRVSFGARESHRPSDEKGSRASGWQLPSPWHEYFLPKPFRVMKCYRSQVPGLVLCSLPCP